MQQKRSGEPGKVPLVADLADGQIGMNTNDAILFMRKTVGATQSVVRVGAEMSAAVAATLREATLPDFRAAIGSFGDTGTWQNFGPDRSLGTTYENSTGRPIMVSVSVEGSGLALSVRASAAASWVTLATIDEGTLNISVTIPPGHQYRCTASGGSPAIGTWAELR